MLRIEGMECPPLADAACAKYEAALAGLLRKMRDLVPAYRPPAPLPPEFRRRLDAFYRTYAAYQRYYASRQGWRISCRAGCACCCCHLAGTVESFETLNVLQFVRERGGFPGLEERVRDFNRRFTRALIQSLAAHPELTDAEEQYCKGLETFYGQQHRCPFLGEGDRCLIYPVRPFACRMYISIADPALCAPPHYFTNRRVFNAELDPELEARVEQAGDRCAGDLEWRWELITDLEMLWRNGF